MMESITYTSGCPRRGSALILTVVLTSLLAIVGVLFLMAARIDKMATSAAAQSRELAFAIDTVIAQISEALVQDIPGVGHDQEYYDYPDANNLWLADREPYESGGSYYWRQVSDIAGLPAGSTTNLRIRVIGERDPIVADANTAEVNADAAGDGVGDAVWVQVPGMMSGRGTPIYAAVRIVDNGGMLNVNTGYKFDPADAQKSRVDGRSPLHVNVLALAAKPGTSPSAAKEAELLGARANNTSNPAAVDLGVYEQEVIWTYLDVRRGADPNGPNTYTPFDFSDELELRYRYLLNHTDVDTRLENWGQFRQNTISRPVDSGTTKLSAWFRRAASGGLDPNYAYRTIATVYNMDRIILPKPLDTGGGTQFRKMVNVNTADEITIHKAVTEALLEADPNIRGIAEKAAQITANLRDYIDDDDEVTVISGLSSPYYGFERPCIYISEFAYRQIRDPDTGVLRTSYAIEFYKPYFEDRDPRPGEWKLVIDNPTGTSDVEIDLKWSGLRRFHVILEDDPAAPLTRDYVVFADAGEPVDTMPLYGYNRRSYGRAIQSLGQTGFAGGATLSLQRKAGTADRWAVIDFVRVPAGWITPDGVARSIQRDISPHKCIRRLWASAAQTSTPNLGNAAGNYVNTSDTQLIQAHPANRPLMNIGELGMVFARSAYAAPEGVTAPEMLIDLANPAHARLFNYLTVIDPSQHGLTAGETRVMGRINVNTAPWFVIAQLPWIQYGDTGGGFQRARDIVAYRGIAGPYRSIGELMQVNSLHGLAVDSLDNQHSDTPRGPDLTPDTARDDYEERDLLFTRISDLVTVRSDVFTAYILVRLGVDGPQRRVIATLDRSRASSPAGRVRLVAQHLVPDPR